MPAFSMLTPPASILYISLARTVNSYRGGWGSWLGCWGWAHWLPKQSKIWSQGRRDSSWRSTWQVCGSEAALCFSALPAPLAPLFTWLYFPTHCFLVQIFLPHGGLAPSGAEISLLALALCPSLHLPPLVCCGWWALHLLWVQ